MLLWKLTGRIDELNRSAFQSLLIWMLLWKYTVLCTCASFNSVSILVDLDVALEAATQGLLSNPLRGFNPCWSGCCSGSKKIGWSAQTELRFQSLLIWMLLWKWYSRTSTIIRRKVSILVDLDVALEVHLWSLLLPQLHSFNPCWSGCCSGRQLLSKNNLRLN